MATSMTKYGVTLTTQDIDTTERNHDETGRDHVKGQQTNALETNTVTR